MNLRNLRKNHAGAINMIVMGLLILVISALAIAIVYPIMGSVDTTTIDANFDGTPAANATNTVVTTTNTVMGLNPLAALVAVAAGIISLLLGAFLVGGIGEAGL